MFVCNHTIYKSVYIYIYGQLSQCQNSEEKDNARCCEGFQQTEVGALVVFVAARLCHQAFVKSIEAATKFFWMKLIRTLLNLAKENG